MKTARRNILYGLFLAAVLALGSVGTAAAAPTRAGETISNTATLTYEVGGVNQTPDDPIASNAAVFVVDRLVKPVVTADTGTVTGNNGTTQYLNFKVANHGNDRVDTTGTEETTKFVLTVAEGTLGFTPSVTYEYFNGTDWVAFTSGEVFSIPAAENLATDYLQVRIAGIFGVGANDERATYHLVATVVDEGGTNKLETTTASDTENVIAIDESGSYEGDDAADSVHSASSTFVLQSASLSISKTQIITAGGYGTEGTSYYLPGAIVEYTITLTNSGSTTADSVEVNDVIPDYTTYVSDSLEATASSAAQFIAAAGTDPAKIRVTYASIPGKTGEVSTVRTIKFKVEID
ncbi:MAG: DUF11 domain-containing protein [Desulfuromonadales bacterium]|nr:DUF11 domain-containing protein [Desulfuromonadales bacterium]